MLEKINHLKELTNQKQTEMHAVYRRLSEIDALHLQAKRDEEELLHQRGLTLAQGQGQWQRAAHEMKAMIGNLIY